MKEGIAIKYIRQASTKKGSPVSTCYVMAKKGWDKPVPKKDIIEYTKLGEGSHLVMTGKEPIE